MTGPRSILVLAAHALAVWTLCGTTMAVGMRVASLRTALVAHAVAAPVIATAVSYVYFTRFGESPPLAAAAFIVGLVLIVDLVVVALLLNRSLDMFRSLLGTWLPLALIFVATLVTGALTTRR